MLTDELNTQYIAVTTNAGWFDVSDRTQIELLGADRTTFLHSFCTNDISRLKPGDGCEAFITDVRGKIVGHVIVYCTDNSLILDTSAGQAEAIIPHLDRYLITEDALLRDITEEVTTLCLVGPQAASVLNDQLGIEAGELTMNAHTRAESASAPPDLQSGAFNHSATPPERAFANQGSGGAEIFSNAPVVNRNQGPNGPPASSFLCSAVKGSQRSFGVLLIRIDCDRFSVMPSGLGRPAGLLQNAAEIILGCGPAAAKFPPVIGCKIDQQRLFALGQIAAGKRRRPAIEI